MNILGIDTATNCASTAILNNTEIACEFSINNKKTHSQKIMPQIKSMFDISEVEKSEINAIAVNIGPGSFTGLRIGLACAKAMCEAQGITLVPVDSLETLAYNCSTHNGIVISAIDAQRDQIYCSLFRFYDNRLTGRTEPAVMNIDNLVSDILDGQIHKKLLDSLDFGKEELDTQEFECELLESSRILMVGEIFNKYMDKFEDIDDVIFANKNNNLSRAASLCFAAERRLREGRVDLSNLSSIAPLYIRKSQAEMQYEQTHSKEK